MKIERNILNIYESDHITATGLGEALERVRLHLETMLLGDLCTTLRNRALRWTGELQVVAWFRHVSEATKDALALAPLAGIYLRHGELDLNVCTSKILVFCVVTTK